MIVLYAIMIGFAGLVVAAMAITQYIRIRRQSLLGLLAVAIDKQLPLAPTIEAFGHEQGGIFGRKVLNFAALLREGVPVAEAMDRTPGLFSREAVAAAHLGEELGALAPTLRAVIDRQMIQQPLRQAVAGRIYYTVTVIGVLVSILTFMFIKIVPAMIKIFDDFDSTLPPLTVAAIGFANFTAKYWLVALIPLVAWVVLFYATLAYVGWVRPSYGLLGRWFTQVHRAAILRALAIAVERGRPIKDALEALDRWYPKGWVRRKLQRAQAHLLAGLPWQEALRQERLIAQSDVALLESAERAGNLPWALCEAAGSGERRLFYRLEAVVQIAFPIVVLALGGFVMFMVVAFFLPLVRLIQGLA